MIPRIQTDTLPLTLSKANNRDTRVEETNTVPVGYRQGLVTAIALFLSLSIAFLRFWSFEAPGSWTPSSTGAAILTGAGIVLQLIALFRALDVRDEILSRYRVYRANLLRGNIDCNRWRHDIVDRPGHRRWMISPNVGLFALFVGSPVILIRRTRTDCRPAGLARPRTARRELMFRDVVARLLS